MKKSILTFTAILSAAVSSYACTGLYVGRKVSVEGNPLVGRTIDSISMMVAKALIVTQRSENNPGRWYVGGDNRGWPLPDTTWKFISTPVASMKRSLRYDSACINEKGLAISGTVTGSTNDEALKADPFVKSGFGESSVVGLLARACTNARDVVKLLGKVIAERGHDMPEIYVAVDKDEAWYIEVYTGHQWAAVKMPEDKVAVIGNQFMLGEFDPNAPDVMCSPDVVNLPLKAGFAKKGPNGLVNLAATYGKVRSPYSNNRTWFGHTVFAPHDKIGDFVVDREYPLFYEPTRKLSKRDMFELMRSRYEGTKYCPEEGGDEGVRVIGTQRQCSSHVLEVDASLPEDRRAMLWLTMTHSEHSPFIPVSAAVTETDPSYRMVNVGNLTDFSSALASHHFRRLGVLAETDRKFLGAGVREYWRKLEDKYMREFPLIVKDGSAEEITKYCKKVQKETLEDAKQMFDELNWYIVSNCLKKGDMPTKKLPPKKPFEYSRARETRQLAGPKIAFITGAVSTNKQSMVYSSLVKAAVTAGYTPVVIPYLEDYNRLDVLINMADALLIGGANGSDDWGKRLSFETKLVRAAAKRKIPILGFCHGHQVINLAFGGTIGKLDTTVIDPLVHKGKVRPVSRNTFHIANIKEGTWLHEVVGDTKLKVNSSHRYEVKTPGKGIIISAHAPDGVVEALEHETLPVTGFQFHPETIGDMGEIYNELIRKALNRKPREE